MSSQWPLSFRHIYWYFHGKIEKSELTLHRNLPLGSVCPLPPASFLWLGWAPFPPTEDLLMAMWCLHGGKCRSFLTLKDSHSDRQPCSMFTPLDSSCYVFRSALVSIYSLPFPFLEKSASEHHGESDTRLMLCHHVDDALFSAFWSCLDIFSKTKIYVE